MNTHLNTKRAEKFIKAIIIVFSISVILSVIFYAMEFIAAIILISYRYIVDYLILLILFITGNLSIVYGYRTIRHYIPPSIIFTLVVIYSIVSGLLAGLALVYGGKPPFLIRLGFFAAGLYVFGVSIVFSYFGNVWQAIIVDIGVFIDSMGFTLLLSLNELLTAPAGALIGSGSTLMAIGLQEYFRGIATTPVLRIEVPNELTIKKPILSTSPDFCTRRSNGTIGYLRLVVRNIGHGAARDCVAQVRVLDRLEPGGLGRCVGGPSGEYVDWIDLTWAGNATRININPSDVRVINLVAMPLKDDEPFFANNRELSVKCGGKPPYAWFTRLDVMSSGCLSRIQDCLTECIYNIEVQVTCENGTAEPIKLKLIIGGDWGHTDVASSP